MARAKMGNINKKAFKSWQEAMENYLLFKKAQGLRDITIKGHGDVIKLFYKRHPEAWTEPQNLEQHVYAFFGEDIAPATYNIRRNYLRQFFNWCQEYKIYKNNPVAKLKKKKDEGRIVQFDEDIIKRLLEIPNRNTFAGLRDYALMVLTLDTGIRPQEAFKILIDDINFKSREIHIRPEVSKTNTARTMPVSPYTCQILQRLIEARHHSWPASIPVICTAEGTEMDVNLWSHRLKDYCKKLGIRIRPYDLRHTFALYFLRQGGHALALQRIMGHATLDMTKRYVALTQGDLKTQHDNASPLNKLVIPKSRQRKIKK